MLLGRESPQGKKDVFRILYGLYNTVLVGLAIRFRVHVRDYLRNCIDPNFNRASGEIRVLKTSATLFLLAVVSVSAQSISTQAT